MRVDVPEGKDAIEYVWGEMIPGIGVAASRFSLAVYSHTTLGLREFEAARLRIAQINGCAFCLDWRTERDGVKVEDDFAESVTRWRTSDALDERTRLAAEYAERYALDHHGLDEEFWTRMSAHYQQREIVELSMCLGSWLSFGRLNRVLGLDTACHLPSSGGRSPAGRPDGPSADPGRPDGPSADSARPDGLTADPGRPDGLTADPGRPVGTSPRSEPESRPLR
ncbi:carboxymuconolactone decarboxylase family protein [Nonomuraea sp. NPDC050404]|uniref:carboxymuconolactone decarboxylase family protein n=1 Tax=Nonomuraea sp. NPDC050404 TaxID=3155783 RepID=UPI0033EB3EB0